MLTELVLEATSLAAFSRVLRAFANRLVSKLKKREALEGICSYESMEK